MNTIQSKNRRIEINKNNKFRFYYFHDKIYIKNNGYDGLALDCQS